VIIADNFITRNPITTQDMESMEILAFPLALAIERHPFTQDSRKNWKTDRSEQQAEGTAPDRENGEMALVGKITSSAAHSIRNPLMIIGGFARSLQKTMDKEDRSVNTWNR
jgi:signal transduction histidine kinase